VRINTGVVPQFHFLFSILPFLEKKTQGKAKESHEGEGIKIILQPFDIIEKIGT
jgi:hypothetical protein